MKSDRGTLIVFEGIDGSGKTTHVERLLKRLATANISAAKVSYKDQPWFEAAFNNEPHAPDAQREAEFFAWAFNRLIDCCINPLLNADKVVIVDRYCLSYFAYQSFHGADVTELASNLTASAPEPDLLILLEASIDTVLERCKKRTSETNDVDFVPFQLTGRARLEHVIGYFQRNTFPGALVISENTTLEEAESRIWNVVEEII